MAKLKRLFQPITVGEIKLENRLVMLGMAVCYAEDGKPTERWKNFYIERAKGGVGLIITSCNPFPRGFPNLLNIYDDKFIPGLREAVEVVHSYHVPIVAQLTVMHELALSEDIPPELVGPSAIAVRPKADVPRELTVEEIQQIVEYYGEAARRAREAGFDGVELLFGVGNIPSRFMSPRANQRQDEYGGSFENRMRFPLEVMANIKRKAGEDYTILFRYSADEFIEGGYDLEGGKQIGRVMEEAGVDCLNLQVGWHDTPFPLVHKEVPLGHWVYLAAGIKGTVNIPVITTYRLSGDPFVAERALAEEKADLIGMARAFIADPEFANKAREGRLSQIRYCLVCCRCIDQGVARQEPVDICSVNARMGQDLETTIEPVSVPKRILVVGGGPAGMEAARVAAMRGHKVMLYDRGHRLGGSQVIGAILNRENKKLTNYLAGQIRNLGVEVRLKTEVTPSLIREIKPDTVVLAVGGIAVTPDVPISGNSVMNIDDIRGLTSGHSSVRGTLWRLASIVMRYFYNTSLIRWGLKLRFPFGKKVVSIGGGLAGCELAEVLAGKEKKVTIVEESKRIGTDIGPATRFVSMMNLAKLGVKIETEAKVTRIASNGVEFDRAGSTGFAEADSVVLATGLKANNELAQQLEGMGLAVYSIGDCVNPQKIAEAVKAGYRLGIRL